MASSDVLEELKIIRNDIQYIKENMVDVDMVLTSAEVEILAESINEYKTGRTIRLNDLERDQ